MKCRSGRSENPRNDPLVNACACRLRSWLSGDTLVPDPANPQGLNRFSYVGGNPLRFVDPSGHCAGSPNDGKDDACWQAYFQALGILGNDFAFLSQWLLADLTGLLGWLSRGIAFEGGWTSTGLSAAIGGLQLTLDALYGRWNVMAGLLGTSAGTPLTLRVCQTCLVGGSHFAEPWNHRITFDSNPDVTPLLHETGHSVDYYLADALQTGTEWWSQSGLIGLGWQKQVHQSWEAGFFRSGVQDQSYSKANPLEDFADTWTAWVLGANGQPLPNDRWAPWTAVSDRRDLALTVAIGDYAVRRYSR
jgi:hypothetical protein